MGGHSKKDGCMNFNEYEGPSGPCDEDDRKPIGIVVEHEMNQEHGRAIKPDDITNLRISLETSTVDEFIKSIS